MPMTRRVLPSSYALPRLAAAAAVAALISTGCYSNPDPTEWNEAAHSNFVAGCTTQTAAADGTTSTSLLASKSTCECIYDLVKAPATGPKGKYPVDWDSLKEYETKQAAARPGAAPPTPPKNLTKAIEECAQ